MALIHGTDGPDFILGTGADDTILARADNDVVSADAGNDSVYGSAGDDVLSGDGGNDILVGGDGDDELHAGDGNDVLSGEAGNDRFFVAGVGAVSISDSEGIDTLDMSGAAGPANINLATGGTVGSRVVSISQNTLVAKPVDVVFTQDITGSFAENLDESPPYVSAIIEAVRLFREDARFGVTAFRDKAVGAFGNIGDLPHLPVRRLTTDAAAVVAAHGALGALNGGDPPESQLEAMLQVALRTNEIGWNQRSFKVDVVITDAPFHLAGDYPGPGPNDGDAILDGNPPGTGEDYPSVAQLAATLLAREVFPIFVVTPDVKPFYDALVAEMGFGLAFDLVLDEEHIIRAVQGVAALLADLAFKNVGPTRIENAIGTDFADSIVGTVGTNMIEGRDGDDVLDGHAGDDLLDGGTGNDRLLGDKGNDTLLGAEGDDTLTGQAGDDDLTGGVGGDNLTGGAGADIFRYLSLADSTVAGPGRDRVRDFSDAEADKIDLQAIDARTDLGGDQAFAFIGLAEFSNVAGQLHGRLVGNTMFVEGDVNGDSVADFSIRLDKVASLQASDFVL
jgi:Ca2+-binding RTX toxin-like protein